MYVIVLELNVCLGADDTGLSNVTWHSAAIFLDFFSCYPLRVGSGRDVNGCHAGETPQYLVSRNGERVRS